MQKLLIICAQIIFVLLLVLTILPPAYAQVGCTQQSQTSLLSQFSDSAPTGSIRPSSVRNIICTNAIAHTTTELRSFSLTQYPQGVIRTAVATAGDAPPVAFAPDTKSVCSSDDGGYCVAASGGGFWLAQYSGPDDVREWGVSTTAPDNGPLTQIAINTIISFGGGELYFPPGNWNFSTPISWNGKNFELIGSNTGGTQFILTNGASFTSFLTIGNTSGPATNNPRVSHIQFINSGATISQGFIQIVNSHDAIVDDFSIFNNSGTASYGVWLQGGANQFHYQISKFEINCCNGTDSGGRSGAIKIGDNLGVVQDVFIGPGVIGSDITGLESQWSSGVFSNGPIDIIDASSNGIVLDPPTGQYNKAWLISHLSADSSGANGWAIGANGANTGFNTNIHITTSWGSSNTLNGMLIFSTNGVNQNIQVDNSSFVNNGTNGIQINGSVKNSIFTSNSTCNNSQTTSNTSDGIYAINETYVNFIGNQSGDCVSSSLGSNKQKYGFFQDTGSDYINWIGNNTSNNLTGSFSNAAPGAHSGASTNNIGN